MNVSNRTLFIADNLDIMRGINSECIDLIYLDPPFNTKKQYKTPIGSPAEGATFKDIWTKPRLFEMHRILKPTGSIYLHCDSTASHYLKLMMDSLFGKEHFRNEIVWGYKRVGTSKKQFARKHDTIIFYSKSDEWVFNHDAVREPYTTKDTRWHNNEGGEILRDLWDDIPIEPVGYPTQKPLALLRRIIKVSSNEGDVILDPFCGCATACVAAEQLDRQWIGVDIAESAEIITKLRLQEEVDQTALFNALSDVIVRTDAPIRTDPIDTGTQRRLPRVPIHKNALYEEQEGLCNGCKYMFLFRNMTIDHIVPKSKGGTDLKENLQLLCNACNSTKGTRSQSEFIKRLKQQGVIPA